jgi:DNA-binding PadR family transcriptional regulator
MKLLSRTEELLMLTVWKLQDDAYSLTIQEAISDLLDKPVSIGAVYVPLERLAKRGLLKTREGAPEDRRGGRRKRFYEVTAKGHAALATIDAVQKRAWSGWTAPGSLSEVKS